MRSHPSEPGAAALCSSRSPDLHAVLLCTGHRICRHQLRHKKDDDCAADAADGSDIGPLRLRYARPQRWSLHARRWRSRLGGELHRSDGWRAPERLGHALVDARNCSAASAAVCSASAAVLNAGDQRFQIVPGAAAGTNRWPDKHPGAPRQRALDDQRHRRGQPACHGNVPPGLRGCRRRQRQSLPRRGTRNSLSTISMGTFAGVLRAGGWTGQLKALPAGGQPRWAHRCLRHVDSGQRNRAGEDCEAVVPRRRHPSGRACCALLQRAGLRRRPASLGVRGEPRVLPSACHATASSWRPGR